MTDFLKQKLAYIAGPYRAETESENQLNIISAAMCAEHVRSNIGYACIVPHLESMYHKSCISEDEWLSHGLKLLSICDIIIVFENFSRSKGTFEEIKFAIENKIPIYRFFHLSKMIAKANGIVKEFKETSLNDWYFTLE